MVLRLQRGGKRTLPRVGTARAISIVIVAEVRLYRDGLARSLDGRDGIHVVGTAVGLADALAQVRDNSPDVVLLDFGPDGKSWLRALVEETPEAKVIVVGLGEDEADVIVCAEAGASGFVGRESSLEHLTACVRSAANDDLLCSPRIAAILLERVKELSSPNGSGSHSPPPLTLRQLEVLQLVDSGLSNKEIANRLCLEVSTVKNHVHQILDKLQVQSRSEAAATWRSWAKLLIGIALVESEDLGVVPGLDALPF
jgi:two-component system, NarL family, nitrate/nitrite response regulator NarL